VSQCCVLCTLVRPACRRSSGESVASVDVPDVDVPHLPGNDPHPSCGNYPHPVVGTPHPLDSSLSSCAFCTEKETNSRLCITLWTLPLDLSMGLWRCALSLTFFLYFSIPLSYPARVQTAEVTYFAFNKLAAGHGLTP